MSDSHIPLVIGESYLIQDWYGMMGFEAVYRGIIEDQNTTILPDMLLFERVNADETDYRFMGVIPEASVSRSRDNDRVQVNLRAHYYGQSIATLVKLTERCGPPKWRMRN